MLLGSGATYATACINYPPEAGFLYQLRSQPPKKPLHKAAESGGMVMMRLFGSSTLRVKFGLWLGFLSVLGNTLTGLRHHLKHAHVQFCT